MIRLVFEWNAAFPGALMGTDWIFEVLEDLKSFALANGMPGLAAKADEALKVAAVEVAAMADAPVTVTPRRSGSTH